MILKNKNIIVLGVFEHFPEKELLFELITRAGGKLRKSLSNNIDYIFQGTYKGEKFINDAKNYPNIKVISEQEVIKMLPKVG
jgi:NAD-dependent DNA ligase